MKTEDHGYAGKRRREEIEDSNSRSRWPRGVVANQSAYRQLLGRIPVLGPDDRAGATRVVRSIDDCLQRGGWTRGEWRRLYALRRVWQSRADGRDARFRIVGNAKTGLTGEQKKQVENLEVLLQTRKTIKEANNYADRETRDRIGDGDGGEEGPGTGDSKLGIGKAGEVESSLNAANRHRPTTSRTFGWGE